MIRYDRALLCHRLPTRIFGPATPRGETHTSWHAQLLHAAFTATLQPLALHALTIIPSSLAVRTEAVQEWERVMAEEHVTLLKQGVEAWNAWRRECPETRPDLGRADLRHLDLIGADLSGANLCQADLRGADLGYASLIEAQLCGADLRRANLRGARLNGADLRRTNLGEADLSYADLSGADLRRADLRGADLRETELGTADMT